ncbi:MAG TPA: hypothetical protein VF552_09350 [Allosphingosinicella sp.]|jgi:hypothetical protein
MSAIATQNRASQTAADTSLGRRALDVTVTILSLGTNKLIHRGTGWLTRHGLVRYVVPAIVLNEAFGAYRAFVAGGAMGWW